MFFDKAKPAWGAGLQEEHNITLGLYAAADKPQKEAVLRVATSGFYRVFVNGVFAFYGPVRCAHGHYRVDEVPLTDYMTEEKNHVAIEVVNYYAYAYGALRQPGFIQAELTVDGAVADATGSPLVGFAGFRLIQRVRKIQRYSFQRPFGESYRLHAGTDLWRIGKPSPDAVLTAWEETAEKTLLPRELPLHTFPTVVPESLLTTGNFTVGTVPEQPRRDRSLTQVSPGFGYQMAELELHLSDEVQAFTYHPKDSERRPYTGVTTLNKGEYAVLSLPGERTGLTVMDLECSDDTTLYFMVDELLDENRDVDPLRMDCLNVIRLDMEPGIHHFMAMEPMGFRYFKLVCRRGEVKVKNWHLREAVHPYPCLVEPAGYTPDETAVFGAAWQSFRQNAADVFTDCPTRERAGWLCDSFFIARAAQYFTGNTLMEKQYLLNFVLPDSFENIPKGMLPMCYPSDHPDGTFILNWAQWYVAELCDYVRRTGDRETAERAGQTVADLFAYLEGLENADGLLWHLPGWVFVEWSKANEFTQDINYPTNMVYAYILRAAGKLYGNEAWQKKGEALKALLAERCFDGTFFVDNAVLTDGVAVNTRNRSETCQYHAFYFGIATPETHPALWKTLTEDFGPDRQEKGKYPEIWPANAFTGNLLRLDLLARYGLYDQCRKEVVGYYREMADITGTLWEHMSAHASCNHGFASYAACLLDAADKRVYGYQMTE